MRVSRVLLTKVFCFIFIAAGSILFHSPITYAQSAGSTVGQIVGIVEDPQQRAIVGATITVQNLDTNITRTSTSNNTGNYIFLQIPPGNYKIKVEASGFLAVEKTTSINIGTTSLIKFTLSVGDKDQNEVIEVVAENEVGKTESSFNVKRERITNLPINQRNFLDFSINTARVVKDRLPDSGFSATSGLSFNGQSGRNNNVTIDGLDNNDIGSGSVRSTFSQDAVQEFQIIENNYSAEFGRALGGIINIVTSNGSNQYNGNLFFFNRNDKTSSRDPFLAIKPPFSQYQFGTVLSGPIKKDRAFFFTSFERLTLSQNEIIAISDAVVRSANTQGFALRNGAVPFSVGNTVVQGRADLKLKDNDTFWVRYHGGFKYDGAFETLKPLNGESNGSIQNLKDNSIAFNNTYINTGSNFVNDTRFLYGRRKQDVTPFDNGPAINLFAPEGTVVFGRNMTLPQLRDERIYQVVDILSLAKNRHQLKFGVDYQSILQVPGKTTADISAGGGAFFAPLDFTSSRGPFISALQNFDPSIRTPEQKAFLKFLGSALSTSIPGFPLLPLDQLSLPVVYTQGFGNADLGADTTLFSLFAQDDIKLKSNLLLKAGLRYDYSHIEFTPSNSGNFSPRIGLSYQPSKLPKLNIHAAYGLFFGLPSVNVGSSIKLLKINQYKLVVLPFPLSIIPFSLPGHHFPESTKVPAGIPVTPQLGVITQQDSNLRSSYTQQINFGLDYELPSKWKLELSYTYVKGIKLLGERNINPVIRPVANPLTSKITGRVDPTRGDVLEFASAYDSYYHGFTTTIRRQLNSKFDVLASYTFSKAIDNLQPIFPGDSIALDNAADPLNISAEKGLSIEDLRHRFLLSGLWNISYGKSKLFRDFTLSTILNINSGRPYNLLSTVDLNMNGDNNDRPAGIGRNVGITPGFASLDLRLARSISFGERYQIQFLAEVFNLFNKVNINPNTVNRNFTPTALGTFNLPPQENGRYTVTPDRYTSALSPRQIQLGFRISF